MPVCAGRIGALSGLLRISDGIDAVLAVFGRIAAWCGFALMLVVVYDVVSRYAGVPKPFGLNSTQIQESEYWLHAQHYYRKNGRPTREFGCIADALRVMRPLYEFDRVMNFGPKALKGLRAAMVEKGWARRYINKQISRVVRMFKWGVEEQLVPSHVWQALTAVEGLKKGRTKAPERTKVQPVADEVMEATLPHLPPAVADMVRFQRLTGCRPGEACQLRPQDLDRSGEVWVYRPESHKTQHQDRDRLIFIGPKAQRSLLPYLLRPADAYCFDPRESPGAKGNAGVRYTKDSYGRAVRRAAERAGVERWSPNRLRHAAATEIRREAGLEAAQVILGHASAEVTQVYAKRDVQLAANVIKRIG